MKKITYILLSAFAAFLISCAPAPRIKQPVTDVEVVKPDVVEEPDEVVWIDEEDVTPPDTTADYEGEMEFGIGIMPPKFELLDDDDTLAVADTAEVRDPSVPVAGGSVLFYSPRGFMDDIVAELVRLEPFADAAGGGAIFTYEHTHRRVDFSLARPVFRANGRRLTSLDLIEVWSRFVRSRPAQGTALFTNVQGLTGFLEGREPLISGFSAPDENTVTIRFEGTDPEGHLRIASSKLIGGPFMLGAYFTADASGARMRLLPNPNPMREPALLAEFLIQTGGDPDPMTAFSAGQYGAMIIYRAVDIDFARQVFTDENVGAALHKLPSDRYFLSCANDDASVCQFVRGVVSADAMLANSGARGELILSVAPVPPGTNLNFGSPRAAVPQLSRPLKIMYRAQDPISYSIAEKLAADLTAAGVASAVVHESAEAYETALVRRSYDVAVGWVQETVLTDVAEQLHLSTMWFSGITDPVRRQRDFMEIPLFSSDNYLLLRRDTRLHGGRVSGMWVEPAGQ